MIPVVFDELTLALELHIADYSKMLRLIASGDPAASEWMLRSSQSLRDFTVRLNERATSMAAGSAVGVIQRYLDDVEQIKQRLAAIEDMVEGGP